MLKVFISYARDKSYGESLATQTHQELKAVGFNVFRDVTGLKPGDVWYSKLEVELETSDVVVLIVSEKARGSKWVQNEISMAEEIGLPVIPVFAENVRSPLWLRHLHKLDFALSTDWPYLVKTIYEHGVQNNPKTPTDRPQETLSPTVGSEVFSDVFTSKFKSTFRDVNNNQFTEPKVRIAQKKYSLEYLRDQYREISTWASEVDIDHFGVYADLDVSGVVQRFRLIQPGAFWMGAPSTEAERMDHEVRHYVSLTNPFWLADTACTQVLWETVMGNNPASFQNDKNNPVEQVNWDDVQEFVQTINMMRPDLTAGLPTEAQWEYACRAGTNTPFSFGANITLGQVNYDGSRPYREGKEGLYSSKKTVMVKSFEANSWGLYEMHGNVMEWCQDSFNNDLGREVCTEPLIDEPGKYRVMRGGSWHHGGPYCRSAYRYGGEVPLRCDYVGFRFSLVAS